MNIKRTIVVLIFSILTLALNGCATHKSADTSKSGLGVTIPNGRSPATDNAPHAPMNDSANLRTNWNYGNDVLWVYLRTYADAYPPDEVEKNGSLRVKFGWWKGYPGKLSVEGRRLDASAPPLRCSINDEPQLDDQIGPVPSYLWFPTGGYWEITGHLNNQSLTFVIWVINVTVPNGSSPPKTNAPHIPMYDNLRDGAWNHGNGALWVCLPPKGEINLADSSVEKDGTYRVKLPWWRGIPGQVSVTGRRLDVIAPPMRCTIGSIAENGDIGLEPCLLFFPSEGYWEITGHIGDKSLTFVVHAVKKTE